MRRVHARWLLLVASMLPAVRGAPRDVSFSQSSPAVQVYDFVEVTIRADAPDASNPFTDVTIAGEFGRAGQRQSAVDGFCDSPDGSVFRVRFMPSAPGEYSYGITFQQGQ